jgi:hypothetical protein
MTHSLDPTSLIGQAIDKLRSLLGANQPQIVTDIATQRLLEALERILPTFDTYALARLIEALSEARQAQAFYDYVHRDLLHPPPPAVIEAPPQTKNVEKDRGDDMLALLAALRRDVAQEMADDDKRIRRELERLISSRE